MSSKRDLVEAHSFNRRRLVTAFVSGAPGGREVEPVRYGRALIAGVVISGLVVAGAAVGGMIKPKLPSDWNENGLVIAKESGARFVAQGDRLFPVINTTSARLIVANQQGEMKINTVPDAQLAGMELRATLGIPGAPDALPPPAAIVNTGWTACVNADSGLRVNISTAPGVTPVPDQALLVETLAGRGQRFIVANGKRYPVAGKSGDNTLRTLGLPANAFQAPGSWVNLLDPGPELKPFSVPGQGERIDSGVPGMDQIGTPIRQGGNRYLLVRSGSRPALFPISDFAYAVYRSGSPIAEKSPSAGALSSLENVSSLPGTSFLEDWPQTLPKAYRQSSPCLALTGSGDFRRTSLATVPGGTGRLPEGNSVAINVEAGHGALVQETSAGVRSDQGGAVLIDSTGTRYAVPASSLGRLGYGKVLTPAVDQSWTVLFRDGPALEAKQAAEAATGPS
jgi:type VII secretion protein EccB